jgi:hypothetical protein
MASVNVNGQKLREILLGKGKPLTYYSRDMGYEGSYLSNVIARNRINGVVVKYLESIGITLDMIVDEKEPKVKEKKASDLIDEGKIQLQLQDQNRELQNLRRQVEEINVSVRTIGNLLTQINEKMLGGR